MSKTQIHFGIITHYYKSKNYGGLLQAYALTRKINNLGYCAEQLCWKMSEIHLNKKKVVHHSICYRFLRKIKNVIIRMLSELNKKNIEIRNKTFDTFEKEIPHSSKVFVRETINECTKDYDAFITGSDQVWNMEWYNPEFFLNFVPDSMYKFSYAASMPNCNLNDNECNIVKEHLKSFNSISVRERKTADYLADLTKKKTQLVLDPTLLLSKSEWDEICSDRLVNEKYIFCYFLGFDKQMRRTAKIFAKKTGLKLVVLPYIKGVNLNDFNFGDIRLFDVSPKDFISLIKYAEYVLTDSFHATVFSNIYSTKYFVFKRDGMNERLHTLLNIFDEDKRFVNVNLKEILTIKDEELLEKHHEYEALKQKSEEYLIKNLKNAEEFLK